MRVLFDVFNITERVKFMLSRLIPDDVFSMTTALSTEICFCKIEIGTNFLNKPYLNSKSKENVWTDSTQMTAYV